MADATEELNYSGKRLVVDSIQVINNLESTQLREISTRVNAVKQAQDSYAGKQTNYWNNLSDDKKITPIEKKTLLKEWESIKSTYLKLVAEFTDRNIIPDSSSSSTEAARYYYTYRTYYQQLNTLLNTTLGIFDDMSITTAIENRTNFNTAFSSYYTYENLCQMVLADQLTNDYWKDLSADLKISPVEKKSLKQQMQEITSNYNALYNQVRDSGFLGQSWWKDYDDVYKALRTYIYTTLALFDDMTETTDLDSREDFDEYFETYYNSESMTKLLLNVKIMGSVGFRVLDSLNETGTENEVGLYHGTLYQWISSEGVGMWSPVGVESYLGVVTELPDIQIENQYFLVGESFTVTLPMVVTVNINGSIETRDLEINGNYVVVDFTFEKGWIYYYQAGVWVKETDKSSLKYTMTFLEYFRVTGELPGAMQDAIQEAVDNKIDQVIGNIHTPTYLGPSDLENPDGQENDWYLYSGATISGRRENSAIYVKKNGIWQFVDPTGSSTGELYMAALYDILELNNVQNGYFAALFCKALYTNSLFANYIAATSIVLRQGGHIEGGYVAGQSGFYLDYNGDAKFNGAEFSGKVIANAESVFNGVLKANANSVFNGRLDAATGTFKGDISAATGTFKGHIQTNEIVIAGLTAGNNYLNTEKSDIFCVTTRSAKTAGETIGTKKVRLGGSGTFKLRITLSLSVTSLTLSADFIVSVYVDGIKKAQTSTVHIASYVNHTETVVQYINVSLQSSKNIQISVSVANPFGEGYGTIGCSAEFGIAQDPVFPAALSHSIS